MSAINQFTESGTGGYSWEVALSCQDIVRVSNDPVEFSLADGRRHNVYVQAKRIESSGSNKPYARVEVKGKVYFRGTLVTSQLSYKTSDDYVLWEDYDDPDWDWKLVTFVIPSGYTPLSFTYNVSDLFNATNPTEGSIPFNFVPDTIVLSSATNSSGANATTYTLPVDSGVSFDDFTSAVLIIGDPAINLSQFSSSYSDYFVGGDVYVDVTDVWTYYGANLTDDGAGITLVSYYPRKTSVIHGTGRLSTTLDSVGEMTCYVYVTDSRGGRRQYDSVKIYVNSFPMTTSIQSVARVNASDGKFDDEGTNAVIACTFDYPAAQVTNYMNAPIVNISGQTPTNTVTWYTSWTENSGFSGQVNFSNYSPTLPITLYGKVTDTLDKGSSYEISVACDTTLGTGTADYKTLPQSFYLLSAAPGGHGLGIGMKVPEDPDTNKKEGLHVYMDATFYKTTKFRQAPGIIKMYAGNSAPDGWLLCDGSAVSRTDYALLFAVIGTTYGPGDGSTTFNVPDLSGRFALGAGEPNDNTVHAWGDNLTYDGTNKYDEPIGNMGGESKHQLTNGQLPKTWGSIPHIAYGESSVGGVFSIVDSGTHYQGQNISSTTARHYELSFGNDEPHNNMPPYTAVNYIISTGEPSENSDSTDLPVVRGVLVDGQSVVENEVASIQASMMLDFFYPVGSYYETSNVNFNPNTDWGGTWDKLDDGLFLQSTHTASKVGTNVSAGLPNITGGGNTCAYGENRGFTVSRWGAFTTGGTYNFKSGFSSYWQTNYLGLQFDASQSNSIYGNSTTVQPPSKLVYIWHRTA